MGSKWQKSKSQKSKIYGKRTFSYTQFTITEMLLQLLLYAYAFLLIAATLWLHFQQLSPLLSMMNTGSDKEMTTKWCPVSFLHTLKLKDTQQHRNVLILLISLLPPQHPQSLNVPIVPTQAKQTSDAKTLTVSQKLDTTLQTALCIYVPRKDSTATGGKDCGTYIFQNCSASKGTTYHPKPILPMPNSILQPSTIHRQLTTLQTALPLHTSSLKTLPHMPA